MATEWCQQLGTYVERHMGKIETTSSTIVGDQPQILHITPKANPDQLLLVSQGTSLCRHPREFCVSVAADSRNDQTLVQGLVVSLRLLADYARVSENPVELNHTVAFADPPKPLWSGSAFEGFCLASGAVDGTMGDLSIDGIGRVQLLLAVPVYADELDAPRGLAEALVAKGYHVNTRAVRAPLKSRSH